MLKMIILLSQARDKHIGKVEKREWCVSQGSGCLQLARQVKA
jgi:hypothetical protein